MTPYPTQETKDLVEAFAHLQSKKEITAFFRDLLTPAEIDEFSSRFYVATLLWTTTLSYLEVAKRAKTSTTTVTRVAQWLYKEPWQGYAVVLKRLHGSSKR